MPKVKVSSAPRGMGRIIPNANGTFTYRYWANGKQVEETFSTKPLAEDRQAQVYRDKRAGEVTFADKSKSAVRFTDYAGEWIDAHANPGTRAAYRVVLSRLEKELGSRTLAQVAADREGAQKLISAAPGSYRRRTRVILVSPCNEAVDAGRIAGHRLRGLRVEEPASAKEFTFATRAQLDQMATELGDRGLVVWLGAFAGLRIGESLGANIADFLMDGHVLRVQRQRDDDGRITDAMKARRAGDFRDVPVSRELWSKVQAAPRDADGWLFGSESRGVTQRAFNKARDAAGLPASYTPHSLRDQCATTLLSNLVSVPDVTRWLITVGHKDMQTTFTLLLQVHPERGSTGARSDRPRHGSLTYPLPNPRPFPGGGFSFANSRFSGVAKLTKLMSCQTNSNLDIRGISGRVADIEGWETSSN